MQKTFCVLQLHINDRINAWIQWSVIIKSGFCKKNLTNLHAVVSIVKLSNYLFMNKTMIHE